MQRRSKVFLLSLRGGVLIRGGQAYIFNMKSKRDKIKYIIVCVLAGLCAAALLTMPEAVSAGAKKGLTVCGGVLIPSLFPFLVLSGFLSSPHISGPAGRLFNPITKRLFGLSGECGSAIFLSAVGGFPVGARMAANLYTGGSVSQKEAQGMLRFCMNSGPAFLLSAVGYLMLGSKEAGLLLYVSTTISMLIIGLFQGLFSPFKGKSVKLRQANVTRESFSTALINSVAGAVPAILSICAWTILFSCLIAVLSQVLEGASIWHIASLFIEVTLGAESAAKTGNLPLLAALIGFGGLCVHCQVLPFVQSCGMSYLEFFMFRALSATLSYGVAHVLLIFIPINISRQVSLNFSYEFFSVSVPATLALLFLSAVLICSLSPENLSFQGRGQKIKKIW